MMNTRSAWFCPSCQKHHAPHVDTCPQFPGLGCVYNPVPYPGYEKRVGTIACACCNPKCISDGCQQDVLT